MPLCRGHERTTLLGDDGSDEHNFLPGRVVFLATNGMSASLDLKEHGLLTHVLLAGLKGEADKEGYEPDGLVTVGELTTYLGKEMPRLAKEFGKTKDEKEQLHFVLGERTVDFNTEGFIHVGMWPEYVQELRNDGVTDAELEPLFRSAEAYLRMWEKAEARAAALRQP